MNKWTWVGLGAIVLALVLRVAVTAHAPMGTAAMAAPAATTSGGGYCGGGSEKSEQGGCAMHGSCDQDGCPRHNGDQGGCPRHDGCSMHGSGKQGGCSMHGAQAKSGSLVKDPVCGMSVDCHSGVSLKWGSQTYHFCSEKCRDLFKKDPSKYAK